MIYGISSITIKTVFCYLFIDEATRKIWVILYDLTVEFANLIELRAISPQKFLRLCTKIFAVSSGERLDKTRFWTGISPSFFRSPSFLSIFSTWAFDSEFVLGDWFDIFATFTGTSWVNCCHFRLVGSNSIITDQRFMMMLYFTFLKYVI